MDFKLVSKFNPMGNGSEMTTPTTLHGLNSWFRSVAYCGSSYSTNNTNAVAFETQNGSWSCREHR